MDIVMTTPFLRTLIERAGQANASLQSLHDLIAPASTAETPEPEPGEDEASPPSSAAIAQPSSIEVPRRRLLESHQICYLFIYLFIN
jgi:hypothetical protein